LRRSFAISQAFEIGDATRAEFFCLFNSARNEQSHGVSNAFTDVKIQAFVMIVITVLIILASVPGLKGGRSARPTPAEAC
jgi:hypothetical protein